MVYRVKTLLYNKYNPEEVFFEGELLTVEDPERLENMLNRGILEECPLPPAKALIKKLTAEKKGGDPDISQEQGQAPNKTTPSKRKGGSNVRKNKTGLKDKPQ